VAHWLVKSEPEVYSIEDLKRDKATCWDNVRNYQARNYLRAMRVGDQVLFYHSSAEPPGVVGLAKVIKVAYPDPSQFDETSQYFDPKATPDNPRWLCPDLGFMSKFTEIIPITTIRGLAHLKNMVLLQKGSRLSVQPVTATEFNAILKLGNK
jgi:predicted RNA-binding protein with PUA-like domain